MKSETGIRAAEVVLPCTELEETIAFFVERLGFRVAAIFPADDPSTAVVSGHGLRVRLQRDWSGPPGVLRLLCDDPGAIAGGIGKLIAPNGTRIELADWDAPLVLPLLRPSFVLTRLGEGAHWKLGRAAMQYRDLIPDRQGGRFIASHIRIAEQGPVPDYVHYHEVRFQMIYCYKGWARVVYEDQGPPFTLSAGDCVLQPPTIRHRVLESSAGLEVIEISSPAHHATLADHALELPTSRVRPDRDFGGQRFVRHEAAAASWLRWRHPGFEARDLGIAAATGGGATAHVVRRHGAASAEPSRHEAELQFRFVLAGAATLECDGHGAHRLGPGDAFVVPPGVLHKLAEASDELEFLEVAVADAQRP